MGKPLKFEALLLQILVAHLYSINAEHQSRRIFNGGRAIRQVTPYGPLRPRFKPFAHKGGPPDVQGVWTGDRYIGLLAPGDGFVSTVYLEDGTFQQQMGRYLSWECTKEKGVYIATANREDTYSNGTIEFRQRCEVGKVDLEEGVYYWKSSADQCPDPDSSDFNNPLNRVDSTFFPGVSTLYCTGNAGAGYTNVGKAGLAAIRPEGVTTGSPLPPPLNPSAAFPPTFAQPSGPKDNAGIWYGDEARSGELVTSDGSFSSVALLPDGTYLSVLGVFASHNCTGTGAYVGSASYTQTYQNLKRVSSTGCTSGVVDLEAQTYTWSPVDDGSKSCPDENSLKFTLNRVATSEALPTPASYACT